MTLSSFRVFIVLCLIFFTVTSNAQQYHVVIGAFASESNAKKFTGYARNKSYDAEYKINPKRNLFYVYVMATGDKQSAFAQTVRLQSETEFKDSWAFFGSLGSDQAVAETKITDEEIVQPTIEIIEVKPEEKQTEEVKQEVKIEEPEKTVPEITPAVTEVAPPPKARGKFFTFQITTADGTPIPGEVHSVDRAQGRDIATYKTGELVDVLKPAEDKPLTVVCGIFGYKEVVKVIDYNDPALTEGATPGEYGSWVIPYQLERLKKGDVTVMYNVSFYKDAVVMLTKSQQEMDELVNMMKMNPAYKIKIHGHTNGNYDKRKIIALGKPKNYFEMKGSDERNGSSKELSKLRGEAVQSYLEANGIEKKRMEVFPWGGTNMLVGENSASAKLNDRIEIEILED